MTGSIDIRATGIRFDGYKGTWSTISETWVTYYGKTGALALDGSILPYEEGDQVTLYLMESDIYGDETAYLIVTPRGQIIDDECYDDLDTYIDSTLVDWDIWHEEGYDAVLTGPIG